MVMISPGQFEFVCAYGAPPDRLIDFALRRYCASLKNNSGFAMRLRLICGDSVEIHHFSVASRLIILFGYHVHDWNISGGLIFAES